VTDYFFDASALVKGYAAEPGRAWVSGIFQALPTDSIILAEITLAEVAAALAGKHRASNGITLAERDRAVARFAQDCAALYQLVGCDRPIIDLAVELTQRHRLRG
jgi:hypothetical protein